MVDVRGAPVEYCVWVEGAHVRVGVGLNKKLVTSYRNPTPDDELVSARWCLLTSEESAVSVSGFDLKFRSGRVETVPVFEWNPDKDVQLVSKMVASAAKLESVQQYWPAVSSAVREIDSNFSKTAKKYCSNLVN